MGRLGRVIQLQPLWVVAMALFSGALLHGFQLRLHSLFWDHRSIFPAFAEHYDSLNRLGELQWWSYNGNGGVSAYYLNILGHNFLTPLSIVSSVGWWLAGRLGVMVSDWVPYYCVYQMVFVPLIFLTGFYCFLSQIVRDPAARFFGLVLAAFGPAAVSGVYGLGVEQAGYSFLFGASWLHYSKYPHVRSFLVLNAATAGLFITLNHLFLYWVALFVPLILMACQFLEPTPERRPVQVIRAMEPWQRVLLASTGIIVALPALVTFSGGADWLRSISNTRIYNFEFLRAGNPLQLLATVAPGVGFQWGANNKEMMLFGGFELTNHFQANSFFFQYGYLGPLCGGLALLGVISGSTVRGRQLLLLVGLGVLVVMLSGFSPFFAPLLVLPSPLRAVNHYSDVPFTIGFSTLLICLAAQGYVVFLKASGGVNAFALKLFGICVGIGIAGFVGVYSNQWREEWIFGFFLVSASAMALVLIRATRGVRGRRLSSLLLVLLVLDVSTNAFWWVRSVAVPLTFKQGKLELFPSPSARDKLEDDYSSSLLVHRAVLVAKDRYGQALQMLPEFALATALRPMGTYSEPIDHALANGVLELPASFLEDPSYSRFLDVGAQGIADGRIETISRTYNSLKLVISVDRPVLFFWKTLHHPSWFAEVDNQPAITAPAFGVYTTLLVPAGRSEVSFAFTPPFLPVLLGWTIVWIGVMGALPILIPRSFTRVFGGSGQRIR